MFLRICSSSKPSHCLLQSCCMAICGFAGVAYTIMTLGHGYALVDGRPLYYIRYVDWLITTPLLLYDICKIGGCPTAQVSIPQSYKNIASCIDCIIDIP